MCKLRIFLASTWLLAASGVVATTTTVSVPLTVDSAHLGQLVAEALGLDERGTGQLRADGCNRLDMSDPKLALVEQRLELSLRLSAHTGMEVLGHCRGPAPATSLLHLEMKPGIDAAGRTVVFAPVGAELRRLDGTPGLLSRPSRALADALIIPRLERVIVDVGDLLLALDGLIEEFLPAGSDSAPRLSERGRLAGVSAEEDGLRVEMAFSVQTPQPVNTVTASEPPLQPFEQHEWGRVEDELDGFLTVLIARMSSQIDNRELQLDFLSLLLETRLRIAEALVDDNHESDPVRVLFLEAWTGLRPLLGRLEPMNVLDDRDLRLAGFIAAGDALAILDAVGPDFGLDVSRDGLRRLARLLMAGDAPASFTPLPLVEDFELRRLFGLAPAGPPAQSRLPSLNWWERLLPLAHANSLSLADSLRGVVAQPSTLDDYLGLVAQLLDAVYDEHMDSDSRIPAEHRELFGPLVRATAWRESCWRHYVGPADEPRVIRSSMGAIGMMQIMGRVWRGVYDVNRLESSIEYNIAAGIGILEHYLVDYALRRGEHQHPGGADNLVRATYAAYNGGPSHLSRYRGKETPARLRAIDDTFWEEFETIRDEGWPPVSRCF